MLYGVNIFVFIVTKRPQVGPRAQVSADPRDCFRTCLRLRLPLLALRSAIPEPSLRPPRPSYRLTLCKRCGILSGNTVWISGRSFCLGTFHQSEGTSTSMSVTDFQRMQQPLQPIRHQIKIPSSNPLRYNPAECRKQWKQTLQQQKTTYRNEQKPNNKAKQRYQQKARERRAGGGAGARAATGL